VDWVPVASLIATPTIVAIFAFAQRRWEHQNEERRELREVLDHAARELNRVMRGAEMLHNHYKSGTTSGPTWDTAHATYRGLLEDTRTARDRLAIRLGMESEVSEAYVSALGCLDDYMRTVRDDALNGVPYSAGKVGGKRRPLIEAQRRFLEAARQRAGSEDEPRRRLPRLAGRPAS
jgi:hypothetical protein